MALTAAEIFRDYETDGVPSSGAHDPKKSNIRQLLGQYEQIINAFTSNGGLVYSGKAALDADLAHAANSMAWVVGDATTANNGIYRKVGASGAGSWTRVADLPYSFIVASDVGDGTPDAIVATSSLPISGSALVLLNVYETNTGSPVTVSLNGGSPLTIKTNSGNDVAPGGLVSGMIVVGRVSGSTFRLVSDQASAALLAQIEDLALNAEQASDRAVEYAALLGSASGELTFATVAGLLADAVLSYSAGTGLVHVGTGDIVQAQGFRYEVAPSGASDNHIETAGGVKLYVRPMAGLYAAAAFGGQTPAYDSTTAGHVRIDASDRLWAKYLVAGEKSFGSAGDDWPNAAGLRDAFTVSRDLTGLTDCHGFADKTVIDDVTDYGGYGVFDSTVIVRGDHPHDHVYSFQDRTDYQGGGELGILAGLFSYPTLSGSGTVAIRYGARISDVYVTGAGTLTDQVGVLIEDLKSAANLNVGLTINQTSGTGSYSIYAGGGAPMYHDGNVGIGTPPSDVKLTIGRAGVTQVVFADVSASLGGVFGGTADLPLNFMVAGQVALHVTNSADSYTVRPGTDGAQPLGDLSRRWAQLYAATATISTSDERYKTDWTEIEPREKAAALEIKESIKKFKWIEAKAKKGDNARWHFGVGAQTVAAIMQRHGLDAKAYGFFCHDEWQADDALGIEAGDQYALRYEELCMFILGAI